MCNLYRMTKTVDEIASLFDAVDAAQGANFGEEIYPGYPGLVVASNAGRSIRQFGFTNPILIDGNAIVLAGHGRLAAARLLGIDQVPVIRLDHLTDAEKRAYVLADNKIALNAGWDSEMLAVELGDLATEFEDLDVSFDLEITGFSTGEVDQLLLDHEADEDAPPEEVDLSASAIPVSALGDLWQLGSTAFSAGMRRMDPLLPVCSAVAGRT